MHHAQLFGGELVHGVVDGGLAGRGEVGLPVLGVLGVGLEGVVGVGGRGRGKLTVGVVVAACHHVGLDCLVVLFLCSGLALMRSGLGLGWRGLLDGFVTFAGEPPSSSSLLDSLLLGLGCKEFLEVLFVLEVLGQKLLLEVLLILETLG